MHGETLKKLCLFIRFTCTVNMCTDQIFSCLVLQLLDSVIQNFYTKGGRNFGLLFPRP